jgi:hypothetical protein
MWQAIEQMVAEALVSRAAADSYVLGVYPRTRAEFLAPFAPGEPGDTAFEVLGAEIESIPSPYSAAYERDHDPRKYADSYIGFVRGFSASSLRNHLLDSDALVDEFFARLHARSLADPTLDAYDDGFEMTLTLRRS